MGREDWIEVQKITFTRWANTYLSRKRLVINDLYEDLGDGIRLIVLLQIVCREKVCRKYNKKPRMRIQKIENLNFAFAFLRNKNVQLTNVGSSDVLDGNQKLILGLFWTLIKTFQVAEIDVEGVSGKDGLLLWVNRSLVDYPELNVKNFTSSWSDGLAFCALIHRFYPNLIDYKLLKASDARENVILAFKTAEETFKIPQLLNVDDVAGLEKPDEKSIMTYVSLLFKEFASGQQKRKAVVSIAKAVNIAQRHQELANEYATLAPNLAVGLRLQIERFRILLEDSRLTITAQAAKEAFAQFSAYKRSEKPNHEAMFVAVESCVGRWFSSCKNGGRPLPILKPPIEDLQNIKLVLDELEGVYASNLQETLENLQKTEIFLAKLQTELEKAEAWSKDMNNNKLFEVKMDSISSSAEVEEILDSTNFIRQIELPRHEAVIRGAVEQSNGLATDHTESLAVMARIKCMQDFLVDIGTKIQAIHDQAEIQLKRQLELDVLAKDCKALIRNLKYTVEELDEEMQSVTKMEDLSKDGITSARQYFDHVLLAKMDAEVVSSNKELQEKKVFLTEGNRHVEVQAIEKVNLRVQKLLERSEKVKETFERELEGAERRDELCYKFAKLATATKNCCANSTHSISNIDGTVAEQFAAMRQLMESLFPSAESAPAAEMSDTLEDSDASAETTQNHSAVEEECSLNKMMDQLEKVNEELEQLHVFDNPIVPETIHELRAQYNSVESALRDKVKSLEKEMALSQLGNLTPQQLTEIKEVFNHFDIDQDGKLERDEFIMACKGLGLTLSEDECHDAFDEMDENDNEEITYDSFSNFGAEQLQSGSSKEDVKTAFDILTSENLSISRLEEFFEPNIVEFLKAHVDQVAQNGSVLDFEKFVSLVFES